MARRGFEPARRTGTTVPRVISGLYKTSEAIIKGSLVLTDSNGEYVLFGGGTDAVVKGVALEGAGTKKGYGEPFASQTVVATGREQAVSVSIADREQEFSCRQEDGSGNIVAPLQTHIGEEYGVAKDADGVWFVDRSETTTKIVRITDIVESGGGTSLGFILVKFLEAVIQG